MPTFKQDVKNHMDNIIKVLESKDAEKALEAFYEFGSFLQIQHPAKDYTATQECLKEYQKEYQKEYKDNFLSDEVISQAGALFEITSVYYIDHATEDEKRRKQGDMALFMTNNALKRAILCFGFLTPNYEERLGTLVDSTKNLIDSQSAQMEKWIEQTVSAGLSSEKYNLTYVRVNQACEEMQEKLLRIIGSKDKLDVFSESDRANYPQIAIAIDQYKKMEELRGFLINTECQPHERLNNFIKAYEVEATKKLLNENGLGKNFKQKITYLFSIVW